MVIHDIYLVILDTDVGYGLMIWEMTVSIWSSPISIWVILSLCLEQLREVGLPRDRAVPRPHQRVHRRAQRLGVGGRQAVPTM